MLRLLGSTEVKCFHCVRVCCLRGSLVIIAGEYAAVFYGLRETSTKTN